MRSRGENVSQWDALPRKGSSTCSRRHRRPTTVREEAIESVEASERPDAGNHESRPSFPYLTLHRSWMLWAFAFGQLAQDRQSGNGHLDPKRRPFDARSRLPAVSFAQTAVIAQAGAE